jgi:hypothetical protein
VGRTPYRALRHALLLELTIHRRVAAAGHDVAATIYHLQRALLWLRDERRRPLPRGVRFLGGA